YAGRRPGHGISLRECEAARGRTALRSPPASACTLVARARVAPPPQQPCQTRDCREPPPPFACSCFPFDGATRRRVYRGLGFITPRAAQSPRSSPLHTRTPKLHRTGCACT